MPKVVLQPDGLPTGHLPFSQLVEANGFVFVAGQVGDDPLTGAVVPGGIAAEVRQMLDNVQHRLNLVGLDLSDVAKATVYLTDMSDFTAYNEVWREYFPSDPPTRAARSACPAWPSRRIARSRSSPRAERHPDAERSSVAGGPGGLGVPSCPAVRSHRHSHSRAASSPAAGRRRG